MDESEYYPYRLRPCHIRNQSPEDSPYRLRLCPHPKSVPKASGTMDEPEYSPHRLRICHIQNQFQKLLA
jgi:hypothetical protein